VDAVVIAGLLAVLLAEVVGEFRERIQGGTAKKAMVYQDGSFMKKGGDDGGSAGGDQNE
jgi:hypothetical protein